jgi:hypothetical protein
MVLIKADAKSEAGILPDEKLLAAMTAFNEDLVQADVLVAGEGLKPSSAGVRIRFAGSTRFVTDGPFPETKELVAGFWIWQVASLEEAIDWARRCPCPMDGEAEIEIRPVFETEDFGDALTPELRATEERQRQRIEGRR